MVQQQEEEFIPTLLDVRATLKLLLERLPRKLGDKILSMAQYQPRVTFNATMGKNKQQISIHAFDQARAQRPLLHINLRTAVLVASHQNTDVATMVASSSVSTPSTQGTPTPAVLDLQDGVPWEQIRIDVIRIQIESKDQGWRSSHGTWTWFDLELWDQPDVGAGATLKMSMELYRNRPAGKEYETYTFVISSDEITSHTDNNDELKEFWKLLLASKEPELKLIGTAQYPGWTNNIRKAEIQIYWSEKGHAAPSNITF